MVDELARASLAMGRAYPEAQMTSMAVGDLKPYPLTSVDVRGLESVVDKVPTWKWMDRPGCSRILGQERRT